MNVPLLPLLLEQVPVGLRQALSQEGIPFEDREAAPTGGRFVLFDSRHGPPGPLVEGQVAIDVAALAGSFERDPFSALVDERVARKRWEIGPLAVSEEVARYDKRQVRSSLMCRLRSEIEAAGGVWLRIGAYPFPYRSAFNFRLDHDEYIAADFEATLRVMSGHEGAFSHYVCGATHEAFPEALACLRGLDVGSHGYRHHTYHDRHDNLQNIRRGMEVLRAAGIEPAGYVSPHGRFNRGLLWALDALGVSHSSEFALAYDELPFVPPRSQVLQIPVHPVCLGIFLEALEDIDNALLFDEETVVETAAGYLCDVAAARYETGEPVFLYGHPDRRIGRYPQVLSRVLETVARFAAVWKTTRSEFAAWWRARGDVRMRLFRDGEMLVLVVDRFAPGYRLAGEYWRGDLVAPFAIDSAVVRFSPSALAFENRRERPAVRATRFDRPQGLRSGLRRLVDWEKVTPVDEISTRNWRGWLKKALRTIRQ